MSKSLLAGYLFALLALLGGIVWATSQEAVALWKFFVFFVPFMVYGLILFNRADSLGFLYLTVLGLLPVLGIPVPPRRFGITVVDVMALAAAFMLFLRFMTRHTRIRLVPDRYAAIALILILPSLISSIELVLSAQALAAIVAAYILFVLACHHLQNPGWTDKFHFLLALGLLSVSLAVMFEKVTGINLSLSVENINALTQTGGLEIRRAAGFFQDPQKAAQFVACLATYLVILLGQRSLRGFWLMSITILALVAAIPALLITVSRIAIASGLGISILLLLFFNKYGAGVRILLITAATALLVIPFAFPESKIIQKVAPEALLKRFEVTQSSADARYQIWTDSWHIFLENPVSGIGPGTYQEYLMQENPRFRDYMLRGMYIPTQPESGYLKILYETGLIGFAGCLYLLVGLFKRLYASFMNRQDRETQAIAVATFGSMMVFLVTFSTLFTVSDARNAMIPLLTCAMLYARTRKYRPTSVSPGITGAATDKAAKPVTRRK